MIVVGEVGVETVYVACCGIVKSSLSCVAILVVNCIKSNVMCKVGPRSFWLGGRCVPLDVPPLSKISRLKSPARIIWWLGCWVTRIWICFWISCIRYKSWGWVGIYIFMIINGVSGLLLIIMVWRYGDMRLGVGIFVMFSFV